MSDDVTRLAEVLAAHELRWFTHGDVRLYDVAHCSQTCGWSMRLKASMRPDDCYDAHRIHVAGVIAPLIAEARLLGATQAKSDAIDAHAELVARMEALCADREAKCAESLRLHGIPGAPLIRVDSIRAALNDPTEETTP